MLKIWVLLKEEVFPRELRDIDSWDLLQDVQELIPIVLDGLLYFNRVAAEVFMRQVVIDCAWSLLGAFVSTEPKASEVWAS